MKAQVLTPTGSDCFVFHNWENSFRKASKAEGAVPVNGYAVPFYNDLLIGSKDRFLPHFWSHLLKCLHLFPCSTSPKVKTNHPWLAIVHPGPWTQLPPAPAPVPTPRSKSVSNLHTSWYRPKVAAPNPFGEDVDDVTQDESAADQTTPSEAGNEGNLSGVTNTVDGSSEPAGDTNKIGVLDLDVTGNTGGSLSDVTEAAAAAAGPHATSDGASRHILPRSLSVPAITSAPSQGSPVPADMTEAGDQVTPCQTKVWIKIISNF